MPDEILKTLIQIEAEPSIIARTVRAISSVEAQMKSLTITTKTQDSAGKQIAQTTLKQADANNKLLESYKKVKTAAEAARQAQARALSAAGSVGSSISPLRGVVGGGAGNAIGIGADVIELTEALPRLKSSLKQIPDAVRAMANELGTTTPRLLALGVGLAALTVIFTELQKRAEATRLAAQGAIQNALDYYTIVNTMSSKQIQDALAAAQAESEAANDRFDAIAKFTIAFEEQLREQGAVTGSLLELGNALGIAGTEIGAVRDEFDKANKAVTDTRERVNNLSEALNSSELAAREAAAAELELAKQRQQATDAFVNNQIAALVRAQTMSGEQAKERLQAIENEIAAVERFNTIAGQSQANIDANNLRLENLKDEYQLLNDLIPTMIAHNDQLAYEKKQRDDTVKAVEQYIEKVKSIDEDAASARIAAHERYADTIIEIAERSAQAAADALRKLEEQRASLALELARNEADAELQRQRDELDAALDFAREEEKAARDHLATLKRIRRDGRRDEKTAILERDAVALAAAKERTKEALDEENQRYDDERKEREIAYRQLLQDQQRQFARERADRYVKYQRDLADAQAQYIRELDLANQKRNQELALAYQAKEQELAVIQQKHAQQLGMVNAAVQQELAIIGLGYQARLKYDAAYVQQLLNLGKALQGAGTPFASGPSLTNPGYKGSNPYISPPSFDTGGRITRTGLIMAHAGEIITNPKRGQSAGGISINVNGVGLSRRQIKQQVIDLLDRHLDSLD